MKKFLPLGCILLLLIFSCEKDTMERCQDRPLEELGWLQREIQSLEASSLAQFFYVQQAELLGLTVFIVGNCCPSCLSTTLIYTCEGENICNLGNCNGLEDQIKNRKLIWHAQNFECNM